MDIIEPGCILLRGYSCYLDGFLIPGEFSHSSIYVGDGKIVHAIAEGVQEIDIIDFLRCDRFCILKPKDESLATVAVERAKTFIGTPYDFDFTEGTDALYCHELSATCYSMLPIEKKQVKICGIRFKVPRYTCDSFLDSEDFETVMEVNPKSGRFFSKNASDSRNSGIMH